jgi:pyruvate,water dikinase
VGGKGHSLIRIAAAGLPVPPGAVLTTVFFAPWFDAINSFQAWRDIASAPQEQWPARCVEVKERARALPRTADQSAALEECCRVLSRAGEGTFFAVRSSSPEEDLGTASFAGGYETRLGVALPDLENAVRQCFASSLDARVLVYKAARGFDVASPRMAVVVQQQIASEIAGVGFSLNPLTNDYDEAVIDANWGLGESVVSGLASPDHFVVDKLTGRRIEEKVGAKQVSIWLAPHGGTVERSGHRSSEKTLTDAQIGEVSDMVRRVEELYGAPTDIEWAYADGRLYVLQARPITTFVPLPPELMTRPGEPRRLYQDAALSDGLTINAPISPMGLAWMDAFLSSTFDHLVGPVESGQDPDNSLLLTAGGRMYSNLSVAMWWRNPKGLAKRSELLSSVTAQILANGDLIKYRTATRPAWMGLPTLKRLPRLLWRLRPFLGHSLRALLAPRRTRAAYQATTEAYEIFMRRGIDHGLPLAEFRSRYMAPSGRHLFDVTLPPLVAFMSAFGIVSLLVGRKSSELKALGERLKLGFSGNVVVEMGDALFRLAGLLTPEDVADLPALADRIARGDLSPEFLEAWKRFDDRFGCRGPMEMDVASPRYADDPLLALRQMSFMAVGDAAFDPQVGHARRREERRAAYEELMRRFGWFRRRVLRHAHLVIDLFAGTRDTPKYHLVLFNYAVRQRVLIEGGRLAAEGRLDAAEHAFDLTFADLEAADSDRSLDLRRIREERTRFLRVLEAQVKRFPSIIDSRGRILRPPARKEQPGELSGMAVSEGVVIGPVKVLHTPNEKPIKKGDVLVAYTTDPGWTPLFVNAAAVVLEVGGMLQHGAVVAREYGKPCVAGIDGVMTKLRDAQFVEVDGTAGVVRLLSSGPAEAPPSL